MSEQWEGYWVIQAKFRVPGKEAKQTDFEWLREQFKGEMEKFRTRKTRLKTPDHYLLFTNIVLTAVAGTGGRDRATKMEEEYASKYGIKNIRIISYDDIREYLDNSRDIATAYAPFVLPGDVLLQVLELSEVNEKRRERIAEIANRYLETTFRENAQAKLDHAGKLTSDRINLERVFIDLYATSNGEPPLETDKQPRFVSSVILSGSRILKETAKVENRYLLIAGPGYGKSTLTQFLTQLYSAHFLRENSKQIQLMDEVGPFIEYADTVCNERPRWPRLPFRMALKDYAGWMAERQARNRDDLVSVVEYFRVLINKKSGSGNLSIEELESLIRAFPTIFIFDGLDEVPATSNRTEVINEIYSFTETILRSLGADYIVIATTRPQGYSNEFENGKYRHLYITDLRRKDCFFYLKKLASSLVEDSSEREQMLQILKNALADSETSRLMQSPLQASIMAILVKSGGEPARNRNDLFTDYYDIVFRRERQRNVSRVLTERPDYIREIHYRVGLKLQEMSQTSENVASVISVAGFEELIKDYLTELDLGESEITETTREIVLASTDRLVFISEIQDRKVGFMIRSLQEYFAANGYIRNVPDEESSKKLRAISENVYWTNTLLFCFGYIAKFKDYQVSAIESICHELNGSSDDPFAQSLSSIPKLGSWLALDILNEGIFQGNPRNENKFGHFIHSLFGIPLIGKHEGILRLPKRLIEKFVIRDIENCLAESNGNMTAWNIGLQLCTKGYPVGEMLIRYLPSAYDQLFEILKLFIRRGVEYRLVGEQFLQFIVPGMKYWLMDFFEEQPLFFEYVVRNYGNDEDRRVVLIELLFVTIISNREEDITGVIEAFGLDIGKIKLFFAWQNFPDKEMYYEGQREIVQNYYINIEPIKPLPEASLKQFYLIALKARCRFPEFIRRFLLAPSWGAFIELKAILDEEEPNYRAKVLNYLKYLNSFFWVIAQEQTWNDDVYIAGVLTEVTNPSIIPWNIGFPEFLSLTKYWGFGSFDSGDAAMILEQLKVRFLDGVPESERRKVLITYFKIYDDFFEKESLRDKVTENIRSTIVESFKVFLTGSDQISPDYFNSAIDLIKVEELAIVYQEIPVYSKFRIKPWRKVGSRFEVEYNPEKMRDLMRWQIRAGKLPCYKTMAQLILTYGDLLDKVDPTLIPFGEMLIHKADSDEEKYKAALLLVDPEFGEDHYREICRLIDKYAVTSADEDFIVSFLFMLPWCPVNEHIGRVLSYVYSIFREAALIYNARFIEFVSQYVGRVPVQFGSREG